MPTSRPLIKPAISCCHNHVRLHASNAHFKIVHGHTSCRNLNCQLAVPNCLLSLYLCTHTRTYVYICIFYIIWSTSFVCLQMSLSMACVYMSCCLQLLLLAFPFLGLHWHVLYAVFYCTDRGRQSDRQLDIAFSYATLSWGIIIVLLNVLRAPRGTIC